MIEKRLNPKQQAFADCYIELGNIEQAALKAGYSKAYARGNAHKLVANVSVKKYIEIRMEELQSKRVASQQEVLEYLTSVMRGEQQEETLRGIGEGAQTISDIDVSAKDRIKAAEMLGKRYAMWTDKQQIEGAIPIVIEDDVSE
ncbi:MAG: terminase small subunit [Psychrobacillus psychrotolerans]|uniref:terminase small subunit n=1 Tax=Psychrobacillus psychrotolerans TaxID=126156 RepID=UPI003BAFAFA2